MKALKIILQSEFFYIISFIIITFYVIFTTKIIKYTSSFESENVNINARILSVKKDNEKIKLILKINNEKFDASYYYKEDISLKEGYIINISGNINDIDNNRVFNTFNYKKYLYNNKIYKKINIEKIKIKNNNVNIFQKIKNKINERVSFNKYIALFIVGDKTLLENDIYNSFKNTGVAHLLAISGMHVSVFVLILKKILSFLNNDLRDFIIICFLLFYSYLVNFSPSIMRVFLCFLLLRISKKLNINLSNRQILYFVALLMLIINPFLIYNIAFLYSFVTAYGVMITSKYTTKNYILNIIIITFFAFLFTLPITASLNYEINIITFLGNLLLIPLITFFIYPFSLITFLFPFLKNIYSLCTNIMENIIVFLDSIKIFRVIIPKINIWVIILYYLFLLLFVILNRKSFFVGIILLIFLLKVSYKLDNSYYVYFMDVSQGDNSIIIYPHKKDVIMIDTGGVVNASYHVSNNIILFLKSIGISKITTLIITHGDYDHMGEAINLIEKFKVEKVIFNCGDFNDLESELIKVLNKKKIPYYSCIKELNIDNNKLYFLQTKEYDNENDNSNVVYTEINGHKFMFMGDAGINKEKDILDKYTISNIDVLKVGHHGSKTSSSKSFINEMNLQYSIISVGKNNRYGHPNKEVLNVLDNSKTYRTDQDGSIMFKIKNNKLKIETCKP